MGIVITSRTRRECPRCAGRLLATPIGKDSRDGISRCASDGCGWRGKTLKPSSEKRRSGKKYGTWPRTPLNLSSKERKRKRKGKQKAQPSKVFKPKGSDNPKKQKYKMKKGSLARASPQTVSNSCEGGRFISWKRSPSEVVTPSTSQLPDGKRSRMQGGEKTPRERDNWPSSERYPPSGDCTGE